MNSLTPDGVSDFEFHLNFQGKCLSFIWIPTVSETSPNWELTHKALK